MSTNDDDYVGYKHPPKKNRFPPGKSGCPTGRRGKGDKPRKAEDWLAVLSRILGRPVIIKDNGEQRRVTLLDAFLMKLANEAAKGEKHAVSHLIKALTILEARKPPSPPDGQQGGVLVIGDVNLTREEFDARYCAPGSQPETAEADSNPDIQPHVDKPD